MSMSIVGTATASQPTTNSTLTFTYPAGIQTGDLILVSLTANKNTWNIATPGYTTVTSGESAANAFRSYLVHRFADGSEGSTVSFVKSTDTSSPLAGTMVVVRGVHPATAIGIQASTNTVQAGGIAASADPAVDIAVNRAANPSRVIYWRTMRNAAGVDPTFSIGGGTGYTLDPQVVAGTTAGGVRYGAAVAYTGDFLGSTGNSVEPSGGVKASAASTDDVHFMVALLGVNEATIAGTIANPTADFQGYHRIDAQLAGQLPSVTAAFDGIAAPPSGSIAGTLANVTANFQGSTPVLGILAGTITPSMEIRAETRQFGEHVILVEKDHRAFLVVDDGTDTGLKPIKRSKVTQQ